MDRQQELTVDEAAQQLGVNVETIRRYMRAQRLAGYQLSRKSGWRIYAASVDALKRATSNEAKE